MSAADDALDLLAAGGVNTVFGFPCEQLEPYYAALAERDVRHVHARSEASAALMADAYARVSGTLGVYDGVGGPGAAYASAGLAEAAGASSPVLALTGDNARAVRGREAIQDADNEGILAPHVAASYDPETADRFVEAVRAAAREAVAGVPGPVHVNCPEDVLDAATDGDAPAPVDVSFPTQRPAPDAGALAELADHLRDAESPVVVAGEGALRAGAHEAVGALAADTQVPVVTSMNGKGVVAEDEPYAAGVAGRWGYCEVANDAVADADLVVGLGCRFGELTTVGWTLIPDDATLAHVDLDPHWLGHTYDVDIAVQADVRATVAALRDELAGEAFPERADRLERIGADRATWREEFATRLANDRTPIDPARVVGDLQRALPDDALLVAATSYPGFFSGAFYEVREPGIGYVQARGSDGINCALPQAIGAKAAQPDRPVVAFSGDGGVGYHIADLETAVREDLPVVVVVSNNQGLGSSRASQLVNYGVDVSTDFAPETDYAAVARGLGCAGEVVEDPDAFQPALEAALERDRPTLLDVHTDPNSVPPVITE